MANKYFLISKTPGILFNQYKGKAIRLSNEVPHTVDEVVVGIKGRKRPRIVTTFRNEKGEIIERAFNYPSQRLRNDVYTRSYHTIGTDEVVQSTTKKEYTNTRKAFRKERKYQKDLEKCMHKELFWMHEKTETNHLCKNKITGEKILSRTSVVNIFGLDIQVHRFVEFPHILSGKIKDFISKILYFEVDTKTGSILQDTIFADGVKFSKNDQFLQFRAYDIDGVKEPITQKFMKDRKLDKYDVTIDTKYIPDDEQEQTKLAACFIPHSGTICFNMLIKPSSKTTVAGTARHEVEHIWHHLLDARNGGYEENSWQDNMFKLLGPIKNKKLQQEANKCTDAIDNYVSLTENFEEYMRNYIEEASHRLGRLAREKYDRQGEKLRQSFPHIPKELL